jgi:ATPase subunit of ABC transporter with duplicated ATPase domains
LSEIILTAQSLRKTWGEKIVFRDLSFSLDQGQKVGLLGSNGSGKSTLLKVLAGREWDYEGTVTRRRDLVVHYLPQEIPWLEASEAAGTGSSSYDGMRQGESIAEYIFGGFGETGRLLARYHDSFAANPTPAGDSAARPASLQQQAEHKRQVEAEHGFALYRQVVSLASRLDLD